MMKSKASIAICVTALGMAISSGHVFAGQQGTVTADVLNVRTGPGTSYSKVTKVYTGKVLNILETKNGWHKIQLSNSKTGWVSGDYVSIASQGSSFSAMGRVNATSLNVRTGPGTSYSVKSKLSNGSQVSITEKSNGWYKISSSNGVNGWVSGDYIKLVGNDSSSNNESIDVSGEKYNATGKVNATSLNVRTGPGTSYSVKSKLSNGSQVSITEKSNGWYKISSSNGVNGWVSGDYIKLVGNDSSSNNESIDVSGEKYNATGKVNATSLNVRTGPGTSYSVKSKLSNGTQVNITERSNGWYKVRTSNGVNGWVSGDFISINNDSNSSEGQSSPNSKVQAVVSVAKAQVGKPYVWGAEGPNSFDCSGLMYYAYKNGAGVELPRTSRAQAKEGKAVSLSNLHPGDLIYFDSTRDGVVNHIAMYIGGNQYVHAPQEGENVKISSTTSSFFKNYALGARRIL